jgi:hypothetical protein
LQGPALETPQKSLVEAGAWSGVAGLQDAIQIKQQTIKIPLIIFSPYPNLTSLGGKQNCKDDGLATDVAIFHVFLRLVGGFGFDVDIFAAIGTGNGNAFVHPRRFR